MKIDDYLPKMASESEEVRNSLSEVSMKFNAVSDNQSLTLDESYAYRRKIEQASAWTNDADALEMVELFPKWVVDKSVIVGERLQYNSNLYKCIQAHTTQSDWTPDVTPALWVKVSVEEYPQWAQPTGAADAYQSGDKVSHSEKHWISTVNANVWEPGVYGWREVDE